MEEIGQLRVEDQLGSPSVSPYPPFDVRIVTPRLELRGATDELLWDLAPLIRAGKADGEPPPYDDPTSLYEPDPDIRVQKWLQGIWRGRGLTSFERWRLYFVVVVDGEPLGMQDLIGVDFGDFRAVETFSWLSADARRRGLGVEMRSAILHLAFEGLGAEEANSEAGVDNPGSNGVSERLGYERNGTSWATSRGRPVLGQRWRLLRQAWATGRRNDITLDGVGGCRTMLGIDPTS